MNRYAIRAAKRLLKRAERHPEVFVEVAA